MQDMSACAQTSSGRHAERAPTGGGSGSGSGGVGRGEVRARGAGRVGPGRGLRWCGRVVGCRLLGLSRLARRLHLHKLHSCTEMTIKDH